MEGLYQLSRPLAYAFLRGPTLNFYRLWAPLSCTAISSALFLFSDVGITISGSDSLTSYMSSFFVSLPGFYIAAMAAVVAFQGGDLDKPVKNVSAVLRWHGDVGLSEISHRVFLCYLFSYLTILSFLGFFACLFGNLAGGQLGDFCRAQGDHCAFGRAAFVQIITFVGASVVFCTVQGLYFLSERVHQID